MFWFFNYYCLSLSLANNHCQIFLHTIFGYNQKASTMDAFWFKIFFEF